jgi:hypothetical protein
MGVAGDNRRDCVSTISLPQDAVRVNGNEPPAMNARADRSPDLMAHGSNEGLQGVGRACNAKHL